MRDGPGNIAASREKQLLLRVEISPTTNERARNERSDRVSAWRRQISDCAVPLGNTLLLPPGGTTDPQLPDLHASNYVVGKKCTIFVTQQQCRIRSLRVVVGISCFCSISEREEKPLSSRFSERRLTARTAVRRRGERIPTDGRGTTNGH